MSATLRKTLVIIAIIIVAIVAIGWYLLQPNKAKYGDEELTGTDPLIAGIEEETIPSLGIMDPVGWADGEAPVAADGLRVTRFAQGLSHPRSILVLENGDVLVAETNRQPSKPRNFTDRAAGWLMGRAGAGDPSPDRIILLRDTDNDGVADSQNVLLDGLKSPFGMAVREGRLIVANTDAVLSFPFTPGDTTIAKGGEWQLMALPGGGNHWARNLLLSPDGNQLYVTVGSASNIGENGMALEEGRAAIHEYDFSTQTHRKFAGGLRNPMGLAFNPDSGELWTTVNERDMLGPDVPPDYLTNVPIGAQYGWPWIYWRFTYDERVEAPMPQYLQEYTRWPEYALGAHVAPLGLVFANGGALGETYKSGAFIARHGSWNRSPPAGYDVIFVPFDDRGNPVDGKPLTVLSGFLGDDLKTTRGRPTWLAWDAARGDTTGGLLLSDDTAGIIWRITAAPAAQPAQD
ncbi:sorbosone dehydrogenase family protein [Croceicoccus sp. Ery15]|uniref:PQQ-dependent sugar dehydrogenase n=1 Tax=Croceicoccus sp. Ery15 TaxID=1703338 RepID=UPI001E396AB8|nr:sorbosone dehydrogenase family protein [Croceicoccus sp. Ery15]